MTRKLIASVNVSIDGFSAGPDDDMSWLAPHIAALAPTFEGVWRGTDTVVIGRTNFVGFEAYWPAVAAETSADPRDRDLACWLDDVEKVCVSRTLEATTWRNSRVARDLFAEVRALKDQPGRDIMVLNSASVIQQLLGAGLVDDLRINLMPEILGDGLPLLSHVPRSSWTLASHATSGAGTVSLRYLPVS